MEPLLKKFKEFFSNFMEDDTLSSQVLLRKIVTSLHVKIFDDCSTICKAGDVPQDVYLIESGQVNVIDSTGMFIIAVLKAGSFFGEYQVLHALSSNFEYRTGYSTMEDDQKDGHWMYVIYGERYKHICEEYPEF